MGIAYAGRPQDEDAHWPLELFVLYTLARVHGGGAGAGLLRRVLGESEASLWVAAVNPRAQAFYRKHGFAPDGTHKNDGIDEIRMRRPAPARPAVEAR